jgi:hypothetical protein
LKTKNNCSKFHKNFIGIAFSGDLTPHEFLGADIQEFSNSLKFLILQDKLSSPTLTNFSLKKWMFSTSELSAVSLYVIIIIIIKGRHSNNVAQGEAPTNV